MNPAEAQVELAVAWITIELVGGLAFFLLGMNFMTEGLKSLAGGGLRTILARLTTNRISGFLTGALVTAIIQSSSVTTVLVVSFVSAGLMVLNQSVGVILGATVGTTVTGQILAFKVTDYALLLVAAGFLARTLARRDRVRAVGTMLLGLGMIFFGMKLMSDATYPLRSHEPFIELMKSLDNRLLAILVAAAFTALVQSSSATIGIVILLSGDGFISLEAGIGLVLGAMVGTCVTALLAGLGKPREAIRASTVHVTINLGSALIWVWLVGPLADALREVGDDPARQIANAASFVAIGSAAILIWFTGPIARVVEWLVPDRKIGPSRSEPEFLNDIYLETPAEAVERVRLEVGRLGELAAQAVETALPREEDALVDADELRELAIDAQHLLAAIQDFAGRITLREIGEHASETLGRLLSAATHLGTIADSIAINAGDLLRQATSRAFEPSRETSEMLVDLDERLTIALRDTVTALREDDLQLAQGVLDRKPEIQAAIEALYERLGRRLAAGGEWRFDLYRLESGLVELLETLHQTVRRIARGLRAVGRGT